MRDLLVIQGIWFAGALTPGSPGLSSAGSLLLMKVGYCFIGLLYGIKEWFHISIYSR